MLIVWITALKFCAELSNTGLQFPADRLRVYSRPSKVLLRDDPHIDFYSPSTFQRGKLKGNGNWCFMLVQQWSPAAVC